MPAAEKLVSLFEPHSDIIVKGGRDVHYGHKLNLTSGKSGMILDVVIEAGNPADAERLLPMLERHIDIYGRPPRQMAADGGYASGGNLKAAKEKGVRDMAFHKKRGLKIEDMVRSRWVYRKLRNFRAGIEAGISCLKRAYGLAPLHLEGPGPLQGLRLVLGGGLQPGALRTPQAGIARLTTARDTRPGGARRFDHVRILPRTPTATTTYYHVEKILPLRNQKSNQPRTRRLWPAQDPGKTPRLMDGHYLGAVEGAFGADIDYAMLVRSCTGQHRRLPRGAIARRRCIGARKRSVEGDPDPKHISTSYSERHNLTMRMQMRRFTRLTNAFSKKIENHCHALALYFVWYNFCRQHKAHRLSPAMAADITDTLRDIEWIVSLIDERAPKTGPRGAYKEKNSN